jgi:hypothetical protein
VSESGFIIEDEKLQLLIGLYGELKKEIKDVKTNVKMDIKAVAIGQDDLKTELKNDIENNINAVKKLHQRCEW